ncbi:hypothetical protein NLJ89_g9702 [Agrocybe chaxingu]|uniref:DUF6533 domain-containing protein n=1 Tax=Agrocybe chaxingu TaxID=84603 RepID=A0A9W8JZH6_9AGAR|nr:hypothetical protein NLJ89_g9702 [Agrocybe chaxingu]
MLLFDLNWLDLEPSSLVYEVVRLHSHVNMAFGEVPGFTCDTDDAYGRTYQIPRYDDVLTGIDRLHKRGDLSRVVSDPRTHSFPLDSPCVAGRSSTFDRKSTFKTGTVRFLAMSTKTVLDLIIDFLIEERKVVYATVAFSMAALYDHIITLDAEIDHIWLRRSKITLVRVLFLINRYMGEVALLYTTVSLLYNTDTGPNRLYVVFQRSLGAKLTFRSVSHQTGKEPMKFVGWAGSTVLWSMQGIMAFRISSMYHHKRAIIATLCAGMASEVITIIVILSIAFANTLPSPIPSFIPVCGLDQASGLYWYYWIPVFFFECLMFSLALRKAIEYSGGFRGIKNSVISARQRPIIYVLFRDSITFPFLALSLCTINFIAFRFIPATAIQASVILSIFIARILGCRLLLNLRDAYYGAFGDEFEQRPAVPIFFAHQHSTRG